MLIPSCASVEDVVRDTSDGESASSDEPPGLETVFDELEELEEIVDSPEERRQVRETMRVLRRADRPRVFGRFQHAFGSRDAGEAMVGSFVFGIPMVVEEGTLEIGRHIARHWLFSTLTLAIGGLLVFGILHAAAFEKVERDLVFGVIPRRLVSIPVIAATMAVVLMTVWGRVEWTAPWISANQTMVAAVVMAVGASLGDVLPEP